MLRWVHDLPKCYRRFGLLLFCKLSFEILNTHAHTYSSQYTPWPPWAIPTWDDRSRPFAPLRCRHGVAPALLNVIACLYSVLYSCTGTCTCTTTQIPLAQLHVRKSVLALCNGQRAEKGTRGVTIYKVERLEGDANGWPVQYLYFYKTRSGAKGRLPVIARWGFPWIFRCVLRTGEGRACIFWYFKRASITKYSCNTLQYLCSTVIDQTTLHTTSYEYLNYNIRADC